MVASAASSAATAESRPSRRGDDGGAEDGEAFVLFEGQRLRSRRKTKAKLVASSSVGGVDSGVELIEESFVIDGVVGSSDDGRPGGNDDDGRGDDESQLLINVAAANYTKPFSAKSAKKSKTSKPSSVPSSQPSVSDVPSVTTDPSSEPSMNPSISGIPSSQVRKWDIVILL